MNKLRDESGMAMVIAIMAGLVVLTLSTAAFSLGTHSLDQSANDRRRVQAVHAAEAGIDRFVRYLPTASECAPATDLPTEEMTTTPPSSFTVTASYFTSIEAPDPWTGCGGEGSPPGAVLITSVGTSASVSRTMEGYYQLTPGASQGWPFGNAALHSRGDSSWTGSGSIYAGSHDADLYTDGNMKLTGGGQIQGSTYSQLETDLSSGTDVKGSVISKTQIKVNGGAVIRGDARSTEGGVSVSGTGSYVFGNVWYCTGAAPSSARVGGTITQECPPDSPPVPQHDFLWPFPYDSNTNPAAWTGYTITSFDGSTACNAARDFIYAIASGNHVVRINPACQLQLNSVVPVNGNLAILSSGTLSAGQAFIPSPEGAQYTLYLAFGLGQPLGCSSDGIGFNGGKTAASLSVLLYTPCRIKVSGNSELAGSGQILAGDTVSVSAGSSFTYTPVGMPGYSGGQGGFEPSMSYRREITN